MPIFQGLPGKSRAGSPKKDAKPTTKPNILTLAPGGSGGPGGPRRPLEAPEAAPETPEHPEDKRFRAHRLGPDPGSKPGREGGEWEFRALARNPKRYKVGWMPA